MSRKKHKTSLPQPVPEPEIIVTPQGPTLQIHEELGLISHRYPDAFLAVRLVGVSSDCFFVLEESTQEEMEFSRATGHRRKAPEGWDFWCLPPEELAALNRSEWKTR